MEPCKMTVATTAVVKAMMESWNARIGTIQTAVESGDYFDVLMLIEDLNNSTREAMDVMAHVQSCKSI